MAGSEAQARVAQARAELAAALDELEDRLNVPKRVATSYRRNPVPWIAAGVGVAAAVAGAIWLAVRRGR